jgi:hypothetical protein
MKNNCDKQRNQFILERPAGELRPEVDKNEIFQRTKEFNA